MAAMTGGGDVAIHQVTPDAAALLRRVADDVFDDRVDADRAADSLRSADYLLFVAVEHGVVVGQCQATLLRRPDGPPQLFVENLGVAPGWRRRGIATALIGRAVRAGRDRGAASWWVAAEADDARANAFYRSLGMQGKLARYYEEDL